MVQIELVILFCSTALCLGDFFSDLEKLDVDAQLRAIDKMMEEIDTDEDDAMAKMTGDGKTTENTEDDAMESLASLFGGECKYKCKNGKTPKPNKKHTPTSNGCGSFGLQLDVTDLPQMTKCCDKHDICYDTCNNDRDACDDDFKTCLQVMCKNIKKDLTKKQYDGCIETTKLMHTGTLALGCSPYLESQKNACTCGDTSSSTSGSQSHTSKATPHARGSDEKKNYGSDSEKLKNAKNDEQTRQSSVKKNDKDGVIHKTKPLTDNLEINKRDTSGKSDNKKDGSKKSNRRLNDEL